eukprot:TRINITY_DN10486_c0_g1_i1.p1 TRINITY_DN10486_c0_g1~~TRINITY_DN10486_c0_g1_i1.p1  ORF type:complete len:229 (+),score=28.04 TRINITY_DN10486_c0_g1_i1:99-785(+)
MLTAARQCRRNIAHLLKKPPSLRKGKTAPVAALAAGTAGAVVYHTCDAKNVTCSTNSEARIAVLVRTHNPTETQLERLRTWAEDLQSCSTPADLWISVDTSAEHLQAREKIMSAVASWPRDLAQSVRFHFYTGTDLLKAYPVFIELLQSITVPVIPGCGPYLGSVLPPRDLGWGFHVEAINLWYQQLAGGMNADCTPQAPREIYSFVWVFEDDVGFGGEQASLALAGI